MIHAYSEVWSSAPNCVSKTAKKDELCFIYILPQEDTDLQQLQHINHMETYSLKFYTSYK